ncbi:MAG: 4-(cytidine 5'-diphospho)-2-C-methyl-D-erythritol kinase, partial [Bacteroidetes bacterium]|nr:4-(cytidine 5'-diphospho)-2-C-methyl-D-erythritol kinase [Bacteroidota bacterium]
MITFPNGKLNLGLSVTGRRPDGFHDIETVMVPVNICDVLEMIPSPHKRQSFTVTGLDIPGKPAENLVG